jgi:histidinol-phosphatase
VSGSDAGPDLAVALKLADVADRVARSRFLATDLVVDSKPNGSPVCDADRAIEAAVVSILEEHYPTVPVFGREHGPSFDGAPTYWAIDPIDGTASFIAGGAGWGFLASLTRDGVPAVAVASSVAIGRRWWAAAGRGALVRSLPDGTPTALTVSTRDQVRHASVGWWDGWRTTAPGRVSALEPILRTLRGSGASVAANGAAALAVAAGDLDGAVMRNPNGEPHHSSVFEVLVREAGRMVSPLADNAFLFSNRLLHNDFLDLLND